MMLFIKISFRKNNYNRLVTWRHADMLTLRQNRHIGTDLGKKSRNLIKNQYDVIEYQTFLIFSFLHLNPVISITVRVILISLISGSINYSQCALNGVTVEVSEGLRLLQFKLFTTHCENINTTRAIRGVNGDCVIGYARTTNLANEIISIGEHFEHLSVVLAERKTTGYLETALSAVQTLQNWYSFTPEFKGVLPHNLCLVDVNFWVTDDPQNILDNERDKNFHNFSPRGAVKAELDFFQKGFLAQSQSSYVHIFDNYDAEKTHKDELLAASRNFEEAYEKNRKAENNYQSAIQEKASSPVTSELKVTALKTKEKMDSAKSISEELRATVQRKQEEYNSKFVKNQDFLADKLVFLDRPPYDPEQPIQGETHLQYIRRQFVFESTTGGGFFSSHLDPMSTLPRDTASSTLTRDTANLGDTSNSETNGSALGETPKYMTEFEAFSERSENARGLPRCNSDSSLSSTFRRRFQAAKRSLEGGPKSLPPGYEHYRPMTQGQNGFMTQGQNGFMTQGQNGFMTQGQNGFIGPMREARLAGSQIHEEANDGPGNILNLHLSKFRFK
jgi:hypothetical protein